MSASDKESNDTIEASIIEEGFNDRNEIVMPSSDEEEENTDKAMMADIMTYVGALCMRETIFQEKLDERDKLLSKLETKMQDRQRASESYATT
jgi:hypothetical protein